MYRGYSGSYIMPEIGPFHLHEKLVLEIDNFNITYNFMSPGNIQF